VKSSDITCNYVNDDIEVQATRQGLRDLARYVESTTREDLEINRTASDFYPMSVAAIRVLKDGLGIRFSCKKDLLLITADKESLSGFSSSLLFLAEDPTQRDGSHLHFEPRLHQIVTKDSWECVVTRLGDK